MPKIKPNIPEERLEPVDEFSNPEELMPLPIRFKEPRPEISIEIPVKPPGAKIRASNEKSVQPEPEKVEPGFVSTKVNLYRK